MEFDLTSGTEVEEHTYLAGTEINNPVRYCLNITKIRSSGRKCPMSKTENIQDPNANQ